MTAPDAKPEFTGAATAADLVVGLVSARWNANIVERLAAGAMSAITEAGAALLLVSAAGAFELPFAARVLARSGKVDAIVVIGAVIRGETTHYELVSHGCASGVMQVQLETGIPIGFGVIAVENHDQALARSSHEHNVGRDAAFAAIEMAVLARSVHETA
jgi:6,7-dimethyl-8-ribityllumazine synthase